MTPRVSVLMPSYNHAAFVKQAIESVLSQSFADFELVVTDDGSDDGTAAIIKEIRDPRLKLEVFAANRGAAEATNRCKERARGEFVALLNSDDYFLPGKLASQVQILSGQPGIAAVFGQVCFVDEHDCCLAPEFNPFANLFATSFSSRYQWLNSFFFHGNGLCHPTALIRRHIFDELGPYDVSLRQLYDFDMWVRLCAQYDITVMPEALLAYRVLTGGGNASAPGPTVLRRTSWEHTRVRRRYRTMDEETLRQTFGKIIPSKIAARGVPLVIQLALTVGEMRAPPQLRLFALETIQDAIDCKVEGVYTNDLHALTGTIDPLQQAEYNDLAFTMAEITKQRDEARLQVEGLAGYLRTCIDALRIQNGLEVAQQMSQAMDDFRISWTAKMDE